MTTTRKHRRFDKFGNVVDDDENGGVMRDGERLVVPMTLMDEATRAYADCLEARHGVSPLDVFRANQTGDKAMSKIHDGMGRTIGDTFDRPGYRFADNADDRERQVAYESYERQLVDAHKQAPHVTPVTWGSTPATPVASALGYRRPVADGTDPRDESYRAYDAALRDAWKAGGR